MRLARSTIKLFLVLVVNSVGGLLVYAYLAREIGSTELGIFFLFQAVSGILLLPSDLGLRVSVEKRMSEGSNRSAFFTSGLTIQVLLLLSMSLVTILFKNQINNYIGAVIHLPLIIYIIFRQISILLESAIKGEMKVGKVANVRLIRQLVWILLSIWVAYSGRGVYTLVLALILSEIIALCTFIYYLDTTVSYPQIDAIKSLLIFAKYSIIPSIGGYSYSWIDILFIGYFLTGTSVSSYELSWQIAGVIALFGNAIMTTIFPQISAWNEGDQERQIIDTMLTSITIILYISIPIFFGTLYLSDEILGLIYGPDYTIASTVLVILVSAMTFQSIRNILSKVLQGINQEESVNRSSLIDISLNIVLNAGLIPIFGLNGAAIATMISLFIGAVIRGVYVHQFLGFHIPIRGTLWATLCSLIMLLTIREISDIIEIDRISTLFIIIGSGAIIYFLLLLSSTTVQAQARRLFNSI